MKGVVLITGAGGFCAAHLVPRLRTDFSGPIVGIGRNRAPALGAHLDDYQQVDMSAWDTVAAVVGALKPRLIFHLAGSLSEDADGLIRSNFLGTISLLEAVRVHAPDARLLIAGSAAEYGAVGAQRLPVTEDHPCRPTTLYGATKYSATLAALAYWRRFGIMVVVARPFNIVGPGMPTRLLLGAILMRITESVEGEERLVKVGNVDVERDFITVWDVVDGYVRMVQGDHWGQVFNLCSGRPCRVGDLVGLLAELSPHPLRFVVDPELQRPLEARTFYGSSEKARAAFGFRPRHDLKDAVKGAWEVAVAGRS